MAAAGAERGGSGERAWLNGSTAGCTDRAIASLQAPLAGPAAWAALLLAPSAGIAHCTALIRLPGCLPAAAGLRKGRDRPLAVQTCRTLPLRSHGSHARDRGSARGRGVLPHRRGCRRRERAPPCSLAAASPAQAMRSRLPGQRRSGCGGRRLAAARGGGGGGSGSGTAARPAARPSLPLLPWACACRW